MNIIIDNNNVFIASSGKTFDVKKPTWVFIHGSAMDHTIWVLFNRYFTSINLNVIAVDLPGHGKSSGKPINDIALLSDWLAKLYDVLKLDTAIVAGHSMGALIAYDFAARYTRKCRGIVLMGFCLPMPVNQLLLDLAQANDHKALETIIEFGYAASSKIGTSQAPGLWMTQGGLRLMEQAKPGVLFDDFTACNNYTAKDELISGIDCPVIFIAGDRDKMTPARGLNDWHKKLKNSQIEVIENCGHIMMMEKPNQVMAAIKKFNRTLSLP